MSRPDPFPARARRLPALVLAVAVLPRAQQGELLSRVSAAVGARARDEHVLLQGAADYCGTPHRFRFSFDGANAFVHEVRGPLGETIGSDGSRCWLVDRTGAPRRLSFEDADKWRAIADLVSDRWLDDPRDLATTADADRIRVAFPSGMIEEIRIDPDSFLPTQASFELHSGPVVVTTSDWRLAGARRHPFRFRITEGGLTDSFEVEQGAGTADASAPCAMPALARPSDYTFDADAAGEIEVRLSPIHLLLVHPLVDGEDVGWFALDTGAEVLCIDPAVADRLQMPKVGRMPLTGVGGTVTSAFRRAKELELGPLTLHHPLFSELDLTPLMPLLKEKVAGIVGYDYLYRATVEIDVSEPVVRVFDPATYRLRGGEWKEIRYSTGNPTVQASFEGDRTGWFMLDTGDPSNVSFFTRYVDEEHLLEGRATSAASSGGVGGAIAARSGEVAWFELGGHRFEHLGALFARATSGSFTTRGLAGSIGQNLMQPFTVVYDFGGARVAFVAKP